MNIVLLVIAILILAGVSTAYVLDTFNKMILLKNSFTNKWTQLVEEITNFFNYANNYKEIVRELIPNELYNSLVNCINAHHIAVSKDDIMDAYIELLHLLLSVRIILEDNNILLNYAEWLNIIEAKKDKIKEIRNSYNDDVLTLNNKIEFFPSNIISHLCNIKKGNYFRNED